MGPIDSDCPWVGEAYTAAAIALVGSSYDGDVLTACVEGGEVQLDCAEKGLSCQSLEDTSGVSTSRVTVGASSSPVSTGASTSPVTAAFCGLDAACIPGEYHHGSSGTGTSRSGTSVTFCNQVRLETVDCLDLGFTGCEVDHASRHFGCTPALTDVLQ